MTAPDPSGCAITGGHRLAVALLATEPPELGDVREALHLARAAGQPTVTVTAYDLSQVLGSVDYLRDRLAAAHEELEMAVGEAQEFMRAAEHAIDERDSLRATVQAEAAWHYGPHRCNSADGDNRITWLSESLDCPVRRRLLDSARPPGGEG